MDYRIRRQKGMEFIFKDIPQGFFKARLSRINEERGTFRAVFAPDLYHYRGG
jgi:hypothetical protein